MRLPLPRRKIDSAYESPAANVRPSRVRGMGTGALRVLSAAGRFKMVSESMEEGISLHETSLARKAKESSCECLLVERLSALPATWEIGCSEYEGMSCLQFTNA